MIIIRVSIESIETRWSVRKLRRWKLFPSNCHSYHHHHHHHKTKAGLRLAKPSGHLASRLQRSARKGKVMIFRDRQTLHHNIYIINIIIIFPSNCHCYYHPHHHLPHYCRIPSNISHHTQRGDKKRSTFSLMLTPNNIQRQSDHDWYQDDRYHDQYQTNKQRQNDTDQYQTNKLRQNGPDQYQTNIKDKMTE